MMKALSIVLTVIIAAVMIYVETLIPPAPREVKAGYDIPEGLDPDKPIIVKGIKFDPKHVYAKDDYLDIVDDFDDQLNEKYKRMNSHGSDVKRK